jgi:CHAT domain-containing protein
MLPAPIMRKRCAVIFTSLLIFRALFAQGQEQSFYSGNINLNELILRLTARGDSAITANNFILAEKYLIKACHYTDTLVSCFNNPLKNQKINFTPKKIHIYLFAYEKMGSLYMMAGNIKLAEELFNKSLRQRESIFNARSVFLVYPYLHLGQLCFQTGDFGKALQYFNEGSLLLDHATTTGFNFDMLRYQLYGLHFEASLQNRELKEAHKYLNRYYYSLNTINPTAEQVAAALEMKARYFLIAGNSEQAYIYIRKAEKKLGAGHDILSQAEIKTLRTKALYYWNRNLTDSASYVFEKLLNSYERNIRKNFPSMSEYEREQFYITLKSDFDLFNSFVSAELLMGKSNNRLLELLYNTQLFTKALLLNELTKTKRNILASGDNGLIRKINEWQSAKDRIAYLHYTNKNAGYEINLLEKQINLLEKEINEKSSFFTKSNEEIHWEQIRDSLNTGEAAIEIIRTRSFNHEIGSNIPEINSFEFTDSIHYIFLIVRPGADTPEGFILRKGNLLEGKRLSYYRNCIRHQIADQQSYDQFWKPINERLYGASRIYLSGDGVYNQINLNVLQNPESGQYVLDETNIYFVTNTKDILSLRNIKTRKTARLYGRPTYSVELEGMRPENSSGSSTLKSHHLIDFKKQHFSDLPGTEKEIQNISGVLEANNWKPEVFLFEEASEESLKSIHSTDVLHIATHGFFLADDGQRVNSMIRSGIVLSGVNNLSGFSSEDGILSAYEATNLSLDSVQLVVLSACETGLGEIKNGEGVYGLQRGFKVAGAENILMSLWKVNDEATAELMIDFYKAWLDGADIHTSFKLAQLNLRKKFPSPFYWGAFILLGN